MGSIPRIQPDLLKAPGNDNGHAVVQGLQQVIGSCGDHTAGLHLAAVRADPAIPEPGQPEQLLVQPLNLLPLLQKPIRRQQATVMTPGPAEGGFVLQGLSAGIDRPRSRQWILDPSRQKAPEHMAGHALTVFAPEGQHRFPRADQPSWCVVLQPAGIGVP